MSGAAISRRRPGLELLLVLALSLGASAVYSVLSLLKTIASGPLGQAKSEMNPSRDQNAWFDLAYQLVEIGFTLVPVVLALYFMSLDDSDRSVAQRLGFDRESILGTLGAGLGLATIISSGGLVVYFGGRALGITTDVVASAMNTYWWTLPVLVLRAAMNGILEEIIVVGFLTDRLRRLGWSVPATIATSALLRGSYHLYQGIGQAIGNVIMGVIFAWWFQRTGRVAPLILAHTVINVGAFVGYALLADQLGLR